MTKCIRISTWLIPILTSPKVKCSVVQRKPREAIDAGQLHSFSTVDTSIYNALCFTLAYISDGGTAKCE